MEKTAHWNPAALRRKVQVQPGLLVLVLALVGFGLVMLFSASYAVALYRRGDPYAYIRPQLLYAAVGLAAMWGASRVDYHIYYKLAWPLLGLSLALLVVVLFMPEYNGCKRWLVIPGVGTLQPSEIAKFAVVLCFAHIISLNASRMGSFAVGVLPFGLVLGVVVVLMLLEPHLSGTLLILGIGAVLMFVGGTGLRWFALAVVGLFVLLLRGITLAVHAPDRFGGLLVVGFVVQVAMQAALNIAVVTNTIPNTGISLPFFSSGGTSLMMLLGEMGIVLSVSRQEG